MNSSETDWGNAFGVYVHWPFCLAKCPYCDFNSHVRHGGVDQQPYAEALKAELSWFAGQTPGRTVSTVFFGGGTPSLMEPATVEAVLTEIQDLWPVAADFEITLEANPTSIEAKNFRGYRSAGVNRLSVGVQALDDSDLKRLGRQHTALEALAAFELAAGTFNRVSFDLIYARPGQTPQAWRKELARALEYAGDHMSLYQLTIEPETKFAELFEQGKLIVPEDDDALALFEVTQELTGAAGLEAYEVSNHARPGAECRHNLIYWNYGEYAGVGPGAHSRLRDERGQSIALEMARRPEDWRASVEEQGYAVVDRSEISRGEMGDEYLLMGLRLTQGISLSRYENLAAQVLDQDRILRLEEEGLVSFDRTTSMLVATRRGRRVLNAVISFLSVG